MKIIIPMTGYGTRFVEAGYKTLKPFIEVEGKPMLWWIVKGMYPSEKDFLFVCRKEHLVTYDWMEGALKELAPEGKIYAIEDWVKKGPVYDVLRASEAIDDEEPCVINYCDFYMTWDWEKLKKGLKERDCDGCVPCYTGFHPHLMVKKNLYASCLTDENDDLIEIREKYSFEEDKTKAKHSPGTYYFKTGAYLKKYCQMLVDSGEDIKGEYYASMPYNFMVRDGKKVWIPTDIDYFCQWGTPEDMADSVYWLNVMKKAHEEG
ncbi:MAG: NTP transferase domain-containing protein [Lachnospiraceae bacterium]|nr:NTP transferase domain-containing protein [Lachnospiraceae bacterium]